MIRPRPPVSQETSRQLALDDVATFHERLAATRLSLDGAVVAERIHQFRVAAGSDLLAAQRAVRDARTADGLVAAVGLLTAGRLRLAVVEAYLLAEAPPRGRPCFFDPSHGPSATDATWTTVRYGTRSVPACLQDAALLAAGVRPDPRTVELDGRRVPYWAGGEATAAYLVGCFPGHVLLGWLADPGTRLPRRSMFPQPGTAAALDALGTPGSQSAALDGVSRGRSNPAPPAPR